MKPVRPILAFVFAVLLVAPVAAQQNQPTNGSKSNGAPLLVIDSFTHDFGEVKAGTPLRHVFKVKNQGNADLLINNVAPG